MRATSGQMIDSYLPGCWLDSGPFGCLGSGLATPWLPNWRSRSARSCSAGRRARPARNGTRWFGNVAVVSDRQQRHLGFEKHLMEALYGYSVVAELRPGTRHLCAHSRPRRAGCRCPLNFGRRWNGLFASTCPPGQRVLTDLPAYPRRPNGLIVQPAVNVHGCSRLRLSVQTRTAAGPGRHSRTVGLCLSTTCAQLGRLRAADSGDCSAPAPKKNRSRSPM